jgi:O-antigen/teichoic acid export membrane protein
MPLIVGLIALGKVALRVLYAETFDAALVLLPWMAWGMFFRLISWPMGLWLLARGSSWSVIVIEAMGAVIAAALPFFLLKSYGLVAAGAAFAISSLIYAAVLLVVFRFKSGAWFGARTYLWAGASAATFGATKLWTSFFPGMFSGVVPAMIVGGFCCWRYMVELRKA